MSLAWKLLLWWFFFLILSFFLFLFVVVDVLMRASCKVKVKVHFYRYRYPSISPPFVAKTIFFPLDYLSTVLINQLTVLFGSVLYDFHISPFIEHFLTFLKRQDVPGLLHSFPAPALEHPLLQRLVLHFSGGYLQTKICMLCVLIAAGVSLQLRCHCL